MSIESATRLWKEVGVDYFEIKPVIDGEGSSVGIKVFSAQDTEAVRTQMDLAKNMRVTPTRSTQSMTNIKGLCRRSRGGIGCATDMR